MGRRRCGEQLRLYQQLQFILQQLELIQLQFVQFIIFRGVFEQQFLIEQLFILK